MLNTNGEVMHKVKVVDDGIIYGGSHGCLEKIFFDEEKKQSRSLGGKLVHGVKVGLTNIHNLITWVQHNILQIEVDVERKLCYALVEVISGQHVTTSVLVHDLGYLGDEFKLVKTIT